MPYIYNTKELNKADEALEQGLFTNVVTTPDVDWVGARSFRVKKIKTSGYQRHTRNKGWNPGTVTQSEDLYTLEFDRDIEFFVDVMDVDETDDQLAAAAVTGAFIKDKAQPEVDAFRFSKMAQEAIADSAATTETLTVDNIFDRVKAMIAPVRKYGVGNLSFWMDSNAMGLLEQSPKFQRTFDVKNQGTAIETRVTSIDGVQLMEVWQDDRMFSKFDFTDGFLPTSDALKIQMMVVARPAIVAKVKHTSVFLFDRGNHTEGDGWLYQNRMYHDLWKLHQHPGTIHVSFKGA